MATGVFQGNNFGDRRAPGRRLSLRSVLGRLKAHSAGLAEDARTARLMRLTDVCAVLDGARTLVESGWVQDRWFVRRYPRRSAGGDALAPDITGACLVGAVVHAAQRHHSTGDAIHAAPALDVLWDAWQETRGQGGPGVAGRAAPREVRAARVRDLTRWNDQPGRTRADVLGLIDLAASRAIMEAMEQPARSAVRSG
jgi:hypothetical protein